MSKRPLDPSVAAVPNPIVSRRSPHINLVRNAGVLFVLLTALAVGNTNAYATARHDGPGANRPIDVSLQPQPDAPTAAASAASRSLPAHYVPSTAGTVTITVTPAADVFAQAIEDAPPAGWTVGTISDGGTWDPVTAKVKWGPFFDAMPRTLVYAVTPPSGATGTATFAGTASFDGVNVAIGGVATITPVPPTPLITWANPANIVYGTALSATQLNATASFGGTAVSGAFVYLPVMGTVLSVGVGQILSVTFTPADTASYSTATKTVTINVTHSAGSPAFTDDPLAAGTTVVKAVHITELRQAIEALRARYGLGSPWTDTTILLGVTPVKAVHLTELRTALNAVYTAAEVQPAPSYSHTILTGGVSVISAVDVAELRAAILAIW